MYFDDAEFELVTKPVETATSADETPGNA